MKRICAYCQKDVKLTREHIWPKCLVKRMPELDIKFLEKNKIITNSDLIISDVCKECNNNLSNLDSYLCSLYDFYFKKYIDQERPIIFKYNYDLLLRSLLKITFNSSRTIKMVNNDFEKYRNCILYGNEIREDIVVKLDIVLPSKIDGETIYPKTARCGSLKITERNEFCLLRVISINSFYFYMIISKDEFLSDEAVLEFENVFNSIPGTIIHPYKDKIKLKHFSGIDTYSIHYHHITSNQESYENYSSKNND